jgi:hypothetical protein
VVSATESVSVLTGGSGGESLNQALVGRKNANCVPVVNVSCQMPRAQANWVSEKAASL